MPRKRDEGRLLVWGSNRNARQPLPQNQDSQSLVVELSRPSYFRSQHRGHEDYSRPDPDLVGHPQRDSYDYSDVGQMPATPSAASDSPDAREQPLSPSRMTVSDSNEISMIDITPESAPDSQDYQEDGNYDDLIDIERDEEPITEEHDAPLSTYFMDLEGLSDVDESDEDITENTDISERSSQPASLNSEIDRQPSLDLPHRLQSDPPDTSPSSSSSAESVHGLQPSSPISPLLLAIGLCMERSEASRQDYIRLREVFLMQDKLLNPGSDFDLPRKLDTLKRHIRGHLPMMRLLRKAIPVILEKQATLPTREKQFHCIERMSWIYWYDPKNLISMILSATELIDRMHFGMALVVDEPTEYYHSQCWGSSNLTTSGEFAYTCENEVIFVGDIIRISENTSVEGFSKGRVCFVGKDTRKDTNSPDAVLISVQVIVGPQNVLANEELSQHIGYVADQELIIWEDKIIVLQAPDALYHLDILMDRQWLDGEEEIGGTPDTPFYIKRSYSSDTHELRSLRRSHPLRGELEIEYFGRDQLRTFVTPPDASYIVRSFPIILFIDDFGIHRNMYRALKAFYWIPAALPYGERRKIANVFTLTLGPHGARVEDIIACFREASSELAEGVFMDINGLKTLVRAFIIVMIGDMPQQADNSGFMRHSAQQGCRSCFCDQSERRDLDFSIQYFGRFHWDTVYDREQGNQLRGIERKRFFNDKGMRSEESTYVQLAPYLDLILSRPWDAPHSEWRGLGRVLQALLFQEVLTKAGAMAYLQVMQSFPFPPKWPRIQSPLLYMWSWSISEAGRATILAPLILRCKSQSSWFRLRYVQEFARLDPGVQRGNNEAPIDNIIRAYAIVAIANSVTGSQTYAPPSHVHSNVYCARQAYQCLLQAAHNAQSQARTSSSNDDADMDAAGNIEQILEQDDADISSKEEDLGLIDRAAKIKQPKYIRLQGLPNVHAGLHLHENAVEYGTVMNCNVLAPEMKHKMFHRLADHASPPNLMAYLFAYDVTRQSIRLGLAGAWAFDHPDLREPVSLVHEHCPRLVQSFLHSSERDNNELLAEAFPEDDEIITQVQEDAEHRQVSTSIKGFCITRDRNDFNLSTHISLRQHGPNQLFLQALRAAFDTDYNIRGIVAFRDRRVRWKQRLAFTDSNGHRHTYNIGDYFGLTTDETEFGRLRQIIVVHLHDTPYLFLVADRIVAVQDPNRTYEQAEHAGLYILQDHILDLLVWKVKGQFLCGLPSLSPGDTTVTGGTSIQRPYFVTAPRNGCWRELDAEEDDKDGEFLLQCQWSIDFL